MKITHEKMKCIGCGTCIHLCSKFFSLDEEGKAHLKGSKQEGTNYELEVDDAGCAKEAADSCPVRCIHVK